MLTISALFRDITQSSGYSLPTFRDNVSVPSSTALFLDFLTLDDGTATLSRNVGKWLPEEGRFQNIMFLEKGSNAQIYVRHKYFDSSIFTTEIRFPFRYIERWFILDINSQSHFSLHFGALFVVLKLAVACLNFQLWNKGKSMLLNQTWYNRKFVSVWHKLLFNMSYRY
jgi:hypothetical protein